jgi:Zn-dependent alcohol dehydrogenase
MVGCAAVTGIGAMLNVVGRAPGRAVLIIGAGGVGLSCVIGARLIGAAPVIVADLAADRLDLATELGADHCIDVGEQDLASALAELSPRGVDWAVDAVGLAETLEQAIGSLCDGGTAIAVGLGHQDTQFTTRVNHLVQGDRAIRGCLYGSANTPVDIPRILDLYAGGRLPFDKLLGREYALDEVNEAYAHLARGEVGRALIRPGRDRPRHVDRDRQAIASRASPGAVTS